MVDAVNSAAMLERMKAEFIAKNAAALQELDEKCEASEAALVSLADQIASGAQPPPEWQPADAAIPWLDDAGCRRRSFALPLAPPQGKLGPETTTAMLYDRVRDRKAEGERAEK